ncbi:cupin-like domain-containing protein [Asticcacaulis solisilvae]|uniref:cupin-like domain-containing protein n=1 Tax=Asticcacaulis solisilvae TaxID=1217274 RepID=UPI003FD81025
MRDPFANLAQVATIDAPSPQVFHRDIVAAEEPVIIRGLTGAWPALEAGRTSAAAMSAYLRGIDTGGSVPVMEAPAATGGRFGYMNDMSGFSFSKRQLSLTATLNRLEAILGQADAPYIAIQMLPLLSHCPDFVRSNPMPLLSPQVSPRLWAGGAVRTQTHNDRDHNLACVLAGRRRFLLFPPEQVANLYVGPLDQPPPLSLADPEAPDYDRFPRFREAMAAARVAYLEPGDSLFMPKYWWHHVTSLEPFNVMINYWWGDMPAGLENPNDGFLAALLAFRHLPPGERRYWKAMFDAYVFGAEGDVTGHIPEAAKGVLGALPPPMRARLRQELKLILLKS